MPAIERRRSIGVHHDGVGRFELTARDPGVRTVVDRALGLGEHPGRLCLPAILVRPLEHHHQPPVRAGGLWRGQRLAIRQPIRDGIGVLDHESGDLRRIGPLVQGQGREVQGNLRIGGRCVSDRRPQPILQHRIHEVLPIAHDSRDGDLVVAFELLLPRDVELVDARVLEVVGHGVGPLDAVVWRQGRPVRSHVVVGRGCQPRHRTAPGREHGALVQLPVVPAQHRGSPAGQVERPAHARTVGRGGVEVLAERRRFAADSVDSKAEVRRKPIDLPLILREKRLALVLALQVVRVPVRRVRSREVVEHHAGRRARRRARIHEAVANRAAFDFRTELETVLAGRLDVLRKRQVQLVSGAVVLRRVTGAARERRRIPVEVCRQRADRVQVVVAPVPGELRLQEGGCAEHPAVLAVPDVLGRVLIDRLIVTRDGVAGNQARAALLVVAVVLERPYQVVARRDLVRQLKVETRADFRSDRRAVFLAVVTLETGEEEELVLLDRSAQLHRVVLQLQNLDRSRQIDVLLDDIGRDVLAGQLV